MFSLKFSTTVIFEIILLTSISLNANAMKLLSRQKRQMCGDVSPIESFPYAVSIQSMNEYESEISSFIVKKHVCGGAILSPYHIITAAHCISPDPRYIVRVGSSDWNQNGSAHLVKSYTKHQGHLTVHETVKALREDDQNITVQQEVEDKVEYDLVVLKLEEPIELDNVTKQAISLIDDNEVIEPGTNATFDGWGCIYTSEDLTTTRLVLQSLKMKIIDSEKCKEIYKDPVTFVYPDHYVTVNGSLNEGEMCTAHERLPRCNAEIRKLCPELGEEGSPLVVDGKLVGILNWRHTFRNGSGHSPTRFIDVAYHRKWIEEQLAL